MKNILHISDIHLSNETGKGCESTLLEKSISSMIDDIRGLEITIDTVIITGDITYSSKKEEYDLAKKIIIDKIKNEFKLQINNFFIIPGNHDISRNNLSFLEETFRDKYNKEEIEKFSDEINNSHQVWKRIENYNSFFEEIFDTKDFQKYGKLFNVRNSGDLEIISLNSAWLSQNKKDNGNLRISSILKKAIEFCNPKKKKILLAHHPIDWLSNDEKTEVSSMIEKNISAFLYGHMHEFQQTVTLSFSEDITLKLQAATIDYSNKNCGYSIIKLEKQNSFDNGDVIYRKYIEPNYSEWGTHKNPDGKYKFSIDENTIFDINKFSIKSKEIKDEENIDHISNLGNIEKKKFEDIFIEPNFTRNNEFTENTNIIEIKSLSELKNIKNVNYIFGRERIGKTAILKYLWINDLDRQSNSIIDKISFYIDAKTISNASEGKILSSLLVPYESRDLGTSFDSKLKSTIKSGNGIFYIDNYDKADKKTKNSILKFINNNIENTFLISCGDSFSTEIMQQTNIETKKIYSIATLDSIKRSDIRKIILCRPNILSITSENEIYKDLLKVVDSSYLSHNYFVYSILLSIYEKKNSLVGILSESDIIENYIEILLSKHDMDSSTSKPKYNDLKHLCSQISAKMLEEGKSQLDQEELYQTLIDFNKQTFNSYELQNYLDPLLISEILTKDINNSYQFSNECFLDYFLAFNIKGDKKNKKIVFSKTNHIKLGKTIEYYTSQNPSSTETIDFMRNEILERKNRINSLSLIKFGTEIDKINLEKIETISFLDIAPEIEDFKESIANFKANRDEDDLIEDELSPLQHERQQKGKIQSRDNSDDSDDSGDSNGSLVNMISEFRNEIVLMSKVFRNSDLIMNRLAVIEYFNFIMDGYVFLTKCQISICDEKIIYPLMLPELENNNSFKDLPDSKKEELYLRFKAFLSILRATIPNLVADLMSDSLSTKKVRFKNIILEKKKSIIENKTKELYRNDEEEFLNYLLILDNDKNNLISNIKSTPNLKTKLLNDAIWLKLTHILLSSYDLTASETDILKHKIQTMASKGSSLPNDRKMLKALQSK
ncbi:metallophosphoesterase [Marinomonas shanghaiensis]|uniref:metallophosphoesterase n=1 Tax=Marinomonas shanghaiensis TaxID=2202418 RepID=UPI000DBA906E|nr:metallophosphoesterase [Marinomonas shanghaiensis]